MTNNQKLYVRMLRAFAAATIICFAYLVVCSDANEEREPWEFVPVQEK
jgi:hypothetical protein